MRPRGAADKERASFECLEGEIHAEAHVTHGFDDDWTGNARVVGGERAAGQILGRQGGKARAEKLSPRRRKQIAKKGAEARWKDHTPKQ